MEFILEVLLQMKVLPTTNSYTYTGTGTLVVLDGNGQTSGTARKIGIDDGTGGATAGNDIIESSEWHPYPSNGVIYSPGNLRVCGVIGDDGTVTGTVYDHSLTIASGGTGTVTGTVYDPTLTIASGGTIYIESNVFKGTNNSSLSLLAKEYVTLNTTQFVKGVDLHDFLFGSWSSPYENILGEEDHNQLTYSQFFAGGGTAVLDLKHQVTATEIDLNNVDFGSVSLIGADFMYVYGSNNASPDTSSDQLFGFLYDFNFLDLSESTHYEKIRCFQDTYAPSGVDPISFTHIKIELVGFGLGASWISFDSVEVPLTNIENIVCFAQDKSWAVIPGNINGYPLAISGAIAEDNFDKNKEQSSKWPQLSYTYDSNLSSNNLSLLPPSVNIVSLKRE